MRIYLFILLFCISCSKEISGIYAPVNSDSSIKQIEFSPPIKAIVSWKPDKKSQELYDQIKELNKYSQGIDRMSNESTLSMLKESAEGRIDINDYEFKDNVLIFRGGLMKVITAVFDIDGEKLKGRKGYNLAEDFIKKK
jgi:hypothetical protein